MAAWDGGGRRIAVTGAAGLVGQNLIVRLADRGLDLVAIDRHGANTEVLARLHPGIRTVRADLARDGGWEETLVGADSLVIAHAQIGGLDPQAFADNNVTATERLIDAARRAGVGHLVHVSSSVVNSVATDLYTESKTAQEAIVRESGIPSAILRPTLMFGWFDRKHLGWLARFMGRTPVFPVPGDGRFRRQPLYAGDFAAIVAACLDRRTTGTFDISGLETIDYIDLVRLLRDTLGLRTPIVRIPYGVFRALLGTYALIDRNPPFTTAQLAALATPDLFPVIDWPAIFGVAPTPLREALRLTFRDPRYAAIELAF